MNFILDQLARSGLLPDDMAAIQAGDVPKWEEIVAALVIGVLDCEAVVRADPTSSWNERRIARQCLAVAFLSALVFVQKR